MGIRDLSRCSLFVALIIIGTYIRIPFILVPFTLQFVFILLCVLILGRKSMITIAVYILLGLIGLPIFSGGGGIGYILMPTFGYILGFFIMAFVCGTLVDKKKLNTFKSYLLVSLIGMIIVYSIGAIYFYVISDIYLNKSIGIGMILVNCVLIFLPKDILGCIIASLIVDKIKSLLIIK